MQGDTEYVREQIAVEIEESNYIYVNTKTQNFDILF